MALEDQRPLHLIRYGISREAQYLAGEFANKYDVLVINGNTAAYMPSALTSFLSSKVLGKRYMIDPMTHAFQHPIRYLSSGATGEPKQSIRKLATALGEPVVSALESERPITPDDFSGRLIDRFVQQVVTFQTEGFRHAAEKSGDIEYLEYLESLGSCDVSRVLRPDIVVAPYFFMDETNINAWWELNIELLEETVSRVGARQYKILAQMVIDQGVLEDSCLSEYISAVGNSGAWAVGIWVDNLDETVAPAVLLKRYVRVIKDIGSTKPVIILYGSYFPVALSYAFPELNISGVCHSLEYGESRPVLPVGGGLPVSRFYYPSIHARLPFAESLRLVRPFLQTAQTYLSRVCSCPVCEDLMRKSASPEEAFLQYGETKLVRVARQGQEILRNFPTMNARDLCVRHYLHCKYQEFNARVTFPEIVQQLENTGKWATEEMGSPAGRHLMIWAKVMRGGWS